MIDVWPLSGFPKKCVDEKTSVERSQSRTGNSIVRGILQVSVNNTLFRHIETVDISPDLSLAHKLSKNIECYRMVQERELRSMPMTVFSESYNKTNIFLGLTEYEPKSTRCKSVHI